MYIGQVALIRFLQDEYSPLLVKGRFDKQTEGYFRSLPKITSRLSPAALDTLKVAVELVASSHQQQSQFLPLRDRGFQNQYRGYRQGQGQNYCYNRRANNSSGFCNSGRQNSSGDVYQNYASQDRAS